MWPLRDVLAGRADLAFAAWSRSYESMSSCAHGSRFSMPMPCIEVMYLITLLRVNFTVLIAAMNFSSQ